MDEQWHCPTCGRYVDLDEAYYAKEDDTIWSYVLPFCDKACADKYEVVQVATVKE